MLENKQTKEKHRKEYFHNHRLKLFQGDSSNENLFDKQFIDLIVTSPPYNVGDPNKGALSYEDYLLFTEKWLSNCYYWSKPQARLLLNVPLDKKKGGAKSVGATITTIAQEIGWQYHSTIVWNEDNLPRQTSWGSWLSAAAPNIIAPVKLILVLYKDSWEKTKGSLESDITKEEFMSWTNGLWTFKNESSKNINHPTPFPTELPYRCIKLFSYLEDLVFDPFCGSGTTLLVAQNNHRKGIGVEIDPRYCELSKQRIIKET